VNNTWMKEKKVMLITDGEREGNQSDPSQETKTV
jgi:hypothetical protein